MRTVGWAVLVTSALLGCRDDPPIGSTTFVSPPPVAMQGPSQPPFTGFGTPPPPMIPIACDDADGLDAAVERDAGLDPCADDTDNDGCPDGVELMLGRCDRPGDVVIMPVCFDPVATGQVLYTMPIDASAWSVVSLKLPELPAIELAAIPLEAIPGGKTLIEGDQFLRVEPGTTLRFEIQADITNAPANAPVQGTIVVLGDGIPVLARPIVILPREECPIPI